jgi:Carboxypeptidase regulatory-like domain
MRMRSVKHAMRLMIMASLPTLMAREVRAQRLDVSVLDSASRAPVSGVIVSVTDASDGTRIYGMSSESGRVVFRLPRAGAWSITARRIGIAPHSGLSVRVDSGDTVAVALAIRNLRFSLPRVSVRANAGVCGRAPSGIDRVSALWEQVSLALRAATLTRDDSSRAPVLSVVLNDAELDTELAPIESRVVGSGRGANRPFFAANPDSLAKFGYIRRERNNDYSYYAPDERVMLSRSFLRTHCFDAPLVDADAALAELQFWPVRGRKVPDVAGTAYVDTLSGELRSITYHYVNTDRFFPQQVQHAGGDVSLRRLENGQWIVSNWSIRMPRWLTASWGVKALVTGYREVGGIVAIAGDGIADSTHRGADATQQGSSPLPTAERGPSADGPRVDTSIFRIARPYANAHTTVYFIDARRVEERSGFAFRRANGRGTFLDSAALAAFNAVTAFDLVISPAGMMSFRVPTNVPAATEKHAVTLAKEWKPGAVLPMMLMSNASSQSQHVCFPKMYLDARVESLSVAELRRLRGVDIAAIEIYAPFAPQPSRTTEDGETTVVEGSCGSILLWSYIDYPELRPLGNP